MKGAAVHLPSPDSSSATSWVPPTQGCLFRARRTAKQSQTHVSGGTQARVGQVPCPGQWQGQGDSLDPSALSRYPPAPSPLAPFPGAPVGLSCGQEAILGMEGKERNHLLKKGPTLRARIQTAHQQQHPTLGMTSSPVYQPLLCGKSLTHLGIPIPTETGKRCQPHFPDRKG